MVAERARGSNYTAFTSTALTVLLDNLKMYLHDYHCRQIILGCSNDNGYTQLLEQYVSDKEALSRITLLEGAPSRKESAGLPYDTAKFAGLFRETKINTFGKRSGRSTLHHS